MKSSDVLADMQSTPTDDPTLAHATTQPIPTNAEDPLESNDDRPLKLISDLVAHSDFPQCSLGELVDIGGFVGVVSEVVGPRIKVRSSEGLTRSFNSHVLRKLYGPRPAETVPRAKAIPAAEANKTEDSPTPKRNVIDDPDWTQEVKAIKQFVSRQDFPACAFGQYVNINSYTGVVVEIMNGSLKVRSPEDVTRSYNADILRKLYRQG